MFVMKGYNRDKVKGEIDKASQKDKTLVLNKIR